MSKTNKEKNEQKLEKFMSENKTRKVTSRKGTITTSNHIDYDKALNKALSMLGTKNENFGFYIIVAINTGLRIGDILNIKKRHFEKDAYTFREQKTSKAKTVPFNKHIKDYFLQLKNKSETPFKSNKGTTYTRQQINRKIKQAFKTKDKNYSSHSLRKSFGRKVYEDNDQSENALVILSKIYNHSNLRVTRDYLDLTQEILDDVYMSM
jgi:integrase